MDLHKEYQRLEGLFAKIDNTELCLHAEGWYCNEFEEFEYECHYCDKCGIGKIYEESAALMRECVSHGMYGQAVRLFALMLNTRVFVRTAQYCFLDLKELIAGKLVTENLDELYNYACYAVYCTAKKEQRVQAVYQVMVRTTYDFSFSDNSKYLNFSELPGLPPLADMPEFWVSWLEFLRKEARQGNDKAGQMLQSSFFTCKQVDEIIKQARIEKTEPIFSNRYLDEKEYLDLYLKAMNLIPGSDYGKMIAVGEEALGWEEHRQSSKCSQIAFRIAHAAACAGDEKKAGNFYELAFFLDMIPENYLAAYRMSPQPELFCRHASERIKNLPKELREDNCGQWIGGGWNRFTSLGRVYTKENRIVLLFLNGEIKLFAEYYSDALQICRNEIGREGEEKKITEFALLSLLLIQERTWKEGCRFMAGFLVKTLGWYGWDFLNLERQAGKGEDANAMFFRECFQHWKDRQLLQEEDRQQYVSFLENWLDAYIEMAVKNFSPNYKLLAAVIAAFGEVKESMGEADGKQKAFARYQDRFCECMNQKNPVQENQEAREKDGTEWFPHRQEDGAVLHKTAFAVWMKYFGMQSLCEG